MTVELLNKLFTFIFSFFGVCFFYGTKSNAEIYCSGHQSIRIMPLGDSITFGINYPGAYRNKLEQLLDHANIKFKFVGSQSNGPETLRNKSNEGYPGKGIEFFQYNITEWMRSNYPDVVLLMVGTNDVWPYHPDDIIDVAVLISKMRLLFDSILSTRPEVKLVVSSIPPSADYWNKWVIAYNSKLHQSLRIQPEPCQRNSHLDLTLG